MLKCKKGEIMLHIDKDKMKKRAGLRVATRSEVIFKKSSNHYGQLDLGVCYQ